MLATQNPYAAQGQPAGFGSAKTPIRRRSTDPTCCRSGGAPYRIDAYTVHPGQVNDHPVIGYASAREIVTAAPDGQQQIVVSGEVDRIDDVCDSGAIRHESRMLVDIGIPNLAGFVVAVIPWQDQFSAQVPPQFFN